MAAANYNQQSNFHHRQHRRGWGTDSWPLTFHFLEVAMLPLPPAHFPHTDLLGIGAGQKSAR
jgi:hypothetical protein